MLITVVVLQIVVLLAVLVLLVRRPAGDGGREAQLGEQMTRLDARAEAMDGHVRGTLDAMRRELAIEAQATREANGTDFGNLRTEIAASITNLGVTLHAGLDGFSADNKASGEALRGAVQQNLDGIAQRLTNFVTEAARSQMEARDALNARLVELASGNAQHQDRLRNVVEERLTKLNETNAAKLEEMRLTVDEKLHATLHTRLTESFGQVTDQLNKVHTGLGEMSKLSEGVDGLSRIFTNVKSRGGFAEVQLGMLLRQMLAPGQFVENTPVRAGSLERVEFAVRFPTNAGERLMPIDAKFPREAWERLEAAYESNLAPAIEREGRAFEAAMRTEAERICAKYINPPVTTPYAIMFLPTEGLYAEVIRRETLQAEIQSRCHVTIAGPTTLSAILTSFQMGFHMLALQEKGDEVWKILEGTKTEFKTFESLMISMEKQVGTVQNTIHKLGVRTRAINRTLREVSDPTALFEAPVEMEEFDSQQLSLAASVEDE